MRLWMLAAVAFICCAAGFGQPNPVLRVSPVPPWPSDGRVPPELQSHSVFFDPATNDLVVLPDPAGGNAAASPLRIELRNQSEPVVSARVSRNPEGLYVYEYTLVVAGRSRRPLERWSLLVPTDPARLAPPPSGWNAWQESTGLPDRIVPGPGFLEYVHFSAAKGNELPPGRAVAAFRVTSRCLPGYVTSFSTSQATREMSAERLASLPAPIAGKVKEILESEWNSYTTTVLGPRFVPGTPALVIAASLHHSIEHLTTGGRLSGDSAFVKAALTLLRSRLESGTEISFAESDLGFSNAAQTPAEKEIADVLRLSLTSAH